jgi:integrase
MTRLSFKFTGPAIDKLKPPASGRIDYNNTAVPGMQLRHSASGRKVYRVKGRIKGSGLQVANTIGSTAIIGLSDAQKAAREFLVKLSEGINPVAERQRRNRKDDTAEDYKTRHVWEKYKIVSVRRMRPSYYAATVKGFERRMLPVFGNTDVRKIDRQSIRKVISDIALLHEPHAKSQLGYIRAFLTWCQKQDLISENPARDIPDPDTRRAEDRERDRWLTDEELALFWLACNRVGGPFAPVFKLLLLTAVRRSELINATWGEFDLPGRVWVVPGRRTKNGNEQSVYLTDLAVEILEDVRAQPLARHNGMHSYGPATPYPGYAVDRDIPSAYAFSLNGSVPLAGFTTAIYRIRAEMAALSGKRLEHFVVHDLRRTAATHMARLGVAENVVKRLLNHSGARIAGVTAIYNRYSYQAERQAALTLWSSHIAKLIRPKAADENLA